MEPSLPVKLLLNGNATTGRLAIAESDAPEEAESCRIEVELSHGRFSSKASDFFEALLRLRQQLEPQGLLICVNGASRDVWPSAMAHAMGAGRQAYRMRLGHQAQTADLVDIFALAPESQPCTIAEQERFRDQWFRSLEGAA